MHAVIRKISAYTGPTLFLGAFTDVERANIARRDYLASIVSDDPWRVQAYRTPEPETDVIVVAIEDRRADHAEATAYLVSAYSEGFGQIERDFIALFSSRDSADAFAAVREEVDRLKWEPSWCEVDKIAIDHPTPPQLPE